MAKPSKNHMATTLPPVSAHTLRRHGKGKSVEQKWDDNMIGEDQWAPLALLSGSFGGIRASTIK